MLLSPSFAGSPGPFLVLALPRSRTRWLAEFLTYGRWRCTHEEARHLRSMEDVRSWAKQPFTGSAETAVAPFWRAIPPGVRVVVIRRPVSEVATSLARVMSNKVPLNNLSCFLTKLDLKLTQVSNRLPNTLTVGYDELTTLEGAAKVFEHALQEPFDEPWWNLLRDVNIQEPFTTFERYGAAYGAQLRRMALLAKGAILHDLAKREEPPCEALIVAEEPFEEFLRDGVGIFAEHAFAVGEAPESFRQKNLPYLKAKAAAGELQVITARSNGRMFGYLMSEITVSRESPTTLAAVETTFFASGEFPGLGMKLQRATLAGLRRKRVSEVWFRAGDRGDGPRLGTMYKRLGASPSGTLWRLDLTSDGAS